MKCIVCGKESREELCLVCKLQEEEYYNEEQELVKPRPPKKTKEDLDD